MGCSPKPEPPAKTSFAYAPPSAISSILLRLDKLPSAQDIHSMISASGYSEPYASYWTGFTLLSDGRHADAMVWLEKAYSFGLPENYRQYCNMGIADTKIQNGQNETALAEYEALLLSASDSHIRYQLLARCTAAAMLCGKTELSERRFAEFKAEFPYTTLSFSNKDAVLSKLQRDLGSHLLIVLQLGIFSTVERAKAFADSINSKGFSASMVEKGMWIVYLGPYANEQAARNDADKLNSLGITSYLKRWSGR